METKISDDLIKELFQLTSVVVSDGIRKALEYITLKKYLSKYYKFPQRRIDFPNGMPNFSMSFLTEGPEDYKSIFTTSSDQKDKIPYYTLSNYEEFKMFLGKNNDIALKMGIKSDEEFKYYQLNHFLEA